MIRRMRVMARKLARSVRRQLAELGKDVGKHHRGTRYMRRQPDDPLAKYRGPITDNVR